MQAKAAIVLFVVYTSLLFASINHAQVQHYTQYNIKIFEDSSATWTVTQVLDINGTVDTWDGFQHKVFNLVDAAMNQTQREMAVDYTSLQMNTALSWETQTKTVKYIFTWVNFSYAQNGQVIVGDIFGVDGFFSGLYGEGTVEISYPQQFIIHSVSPTPSERDDDAQSLEWLGSQYFINGHPHIVLIDTNKVSNSDTHIDTLIIEVATIVTGFSMGVVGFFWMKRRNRQAKEANVNKHLEAPNVETGEEKIIKTLKSVGGSAFQSAITERCNFSKAKTSQLLATLEKRGVVRRYKKGRDKIVMLIEKAKGE